MIIVFWSLRSMIPANPFAGTEVRKLSQIAGHDDLIFKVFSALLVLTLLLPVWWSSFLPMQDYPQHLFMAWVSSTYSDPGFTWQQYFELRSPLGPYRASFLIQEQLLAITDLYTAGKVLVTLYIGLIALLVTHLRQLTGVTSTGWSALLLYPLALHPMFFSGFVNFTLSIPLLLFALINLRQVIDSHGSRAQLVRHLLLLILLFLVHPYTLLVYIVLAAASTLVLARGRAEVWRAIYCVSFASLLFFGWLLLCSGGSESSVPLGLAGAQMKWWPLEWNLSFLAMMFTGMDINRSPSFLLAGCWLASLLMALTGIRAQWRGDNRVILWLPLLCLLVLAGYFVLPFSVNNGSRFTFFSTRLAPILFFLLVASLAHFPTGKMPGRLLAVLCLVLTAHSAWQYHRVSLEVESIVPLFDEMEPQASVLPLIGRAPSAYLDPLFYRHFHYSDALYYHMIRGGGVNPDLFDNRLMPVAFRPGARPGRPPHRELHRWLEYSGDYDYIIARQIPPQVLSQLDNAADFSLASGHWRLYKIRK